MERTLEERIEEERTKRPNLWRVACEMARLNIPVEAVEMIVTLAGPMLKEDDHDQN